MATTTPDNIYSPDSGQAYALTQDLLAMADSVQDALNTRLRTADYSPRAYSGPRAARIAATATVSEGSLWTETDNLRGTYVLRGGSWTPPAPSRYAGWLRRKGGTLGIAGGGTTSYLEVATVNTNTLGITTADSATGVTVTVPEAGLYEFSLHFPLNTGGGWLMLQMATPAGASALSGAPQFEINTDPGYANVMIQRTYFVSNPATALFNPVILANNAATMREEGSLLIRRVAPIW